MLIEITVQAGYACWFQDKLNISGRAYLGTKCPVQLVCLYQLTSRYWSWRNYQNQYLL